MEWQPYHLSDLGGEELAQRVVGGGRAEVAMKEGWVITVFLPVPCWSFCHQRAEGGTTQGFYGEEGFGITPGKLIF